MPADETTRIELPRNAGAVVLYDWMAKEVKDGRNLVRVDVAGQVVWKAAPPTGSGDCFTSVHFDGNKLKAFSWSCYIVSVDILDGKVTIIAFRK